MPVQNSLKQINALERERRELFRRAEDRGLSNQDRERLHAIQKEIAQLWERRRTERAGRRDELYPLIEGRWERAA